MNNKSEVLAFRINDFCHAMGFSRTTTYKLIADGKLKPVKIAGRTLIPRSECERLLAEATGHE